jgi:hypothetical protein
VRHPVFGIHQKRFAHPSKHPLNRLNQLDPKRQLQSFVSDQNEARQWIYQSANRSKEALKELLKEQFMNNNR